MKQKQKLNCGLGTWAAEGARYGKKRLSQLAAKSAFELGVLPPHSPGPAGPFPSPPPPDPCDNLENGALFVFAFLDFSSVL